MNTIDYTILRLSIARRCALRYDKEAAVARGKADRAIDPYDESYWNFQANYATAQAQLWREHVVRMEASNEATT